MVWFHEPVRWRCWPTRRPSCEHATNIAETTETSCWYSSCSPVAPWGSSLSSLCVAARLRRPVLVTAAALPKEPPWSPPLHRGLVEAALFSFQVMPGDKPQSRSGTGRLFHMCLPLPLDLPLNGQPYCVPRLRRKTRYRCRNPFYRVNPTEVGRVHAESPTNGQTACA